jgi:hypothetical protein
LSNRIKNDSRIFEHPQDVVLQILKEDLGKRKLCAHFVPHSLTSEQREPQVTSCQDIIVMADTNIFLTILLWEMRPGVLPITQKQSDRVLNGKTRHPLGQRNWNSMHQDHVDQFFSTLKA